MATTQMLADSSTKNSSEANLYLRDAMDRAHCSWIMDAEAAARTEKIKPRRTALRTVMPVKKVRELKQKESEEQKKLHVKIASRAQPVEDKSWHIHWAGRVYDWTLDYIVNCFMDRLV